MDAQKKYDFFKETYVIKRLQEKNKCKKKPLLTQVF